MKLLVNALSVTNPSGAQVLLGHLMQVSDAFGEQLPVTLLIRIEHQDVFAALKTRFSWIEAPACTRHWFGRVCWERLSLQKLIRREQVDLYFSPSGYAVPRLAVPQMILCQNPWAFVPAARRCRDALKAWLQRRAYKRTMRVADALVFNSRYMQDAYRRHAGITELHSMIAYQAPDPATIKRAHVRPLPERVSGQLLSVSVMGPHKNVEMTLAALDRLKSEHTIPDLRLHIVGSWPDRRYKQKIARMIAKLGLSDSVEIHGFVSREQLERLYAESMAFILLSRCESFGIPAVEAQAFGTPVICSAVCAIPEICGDGGMYADPDDVSTVTDSLYRLLTEPSLWQDCSARAHRNAQRFRWDQVSQPLIEFLAAQYIAKQTTMEKNDS